MRSSPLSVRITSIPPALGSGSSASTIVGWAKSSSSALARVGGSPKSAGTLRSSALSLRTTVGWARSSSSGTPAWVGGSRNSSGTCSSSLLSASTTVG